MAKRKAVALGQLPRPNGAKKAKPIETSTLSKTVLLDDNDSASSSGEESGGGALLEQTGFKINEEYAKRFEHNKKREELQRLEEKYQEQVKPRSGGYGDKYDEDSESSNDEDEDDDGFLATEALDAEISATLRALRSKDPRVYDENVTFYAPIEEELGGDTIGDKKQEPIYLRDYHREKLLNGDPEYEEDEPDAPRTFAQEQEDLKEAIVKEMHAAVDLESASGEDDDSGFLVPKSKPQASIKRIHPSRQSRVAVDVSTAEKDPDTFLSNFMAARAWVPSDGARFQPLESDDEEEDERAEKFEAAYNLRFEDPQGSNELLKSYARDVVAAKSVRREEPNSRKKQRNVQRAKKEAETAERDAERARFRRLKIEETEEKLKKIKKAAGLRGKHLKDEKWETFLNEGWDDEKWEVEMNRRFGDDYYAEFEAGSEDEGADSEGHLASKRKVKVKKPKWDDDIDIKDLIPEFEREENSQMKPGFTLSDSEGSEAVEGHQKSESSRNKQQERLAVKKAARLERKKIEEFVDSRLDLHIPLESNKSSGFRYRETSPISFGLTARDILMAPDASLNQFVGLKKMASFRDAEKKRRDKKNLGKKARLRQWRKETFGNENGPEMNAEVTKAEHDGLVEKARGKKKRSRKSKGGDPAEPEPNFG